jgi:hypothetical protein
MQSRGSLVVIFLATSLLIHTSAHGQSAFASEGLYCTAGLQPDGYLDFSGLPPAPPIVNQSGNATPSAPVTATLPVKGVAGLMATVTIPALRNTNTGSNPAYSVDGGTLQLNGLPVTSSSGTVLTLNFNQPIAGVSLNAETMGRFNYIYTLQVGVPPNGTPTFLTTAEGYTTYLNSPQTQSLQMVGLLDTLFATASVQFEGDEYSGVTLSNIRIRSSSAPDPATSVPRNGLELWLRADQAYASATDSGKWQDQSGNGHDATPSAIPPLLTVDGPHCQPAWQFTGSQFLTFNLPITGWSEMTVFLVAKTADAQGPSNSFAGNSAISWAADEAWGGTFEIGRAHV